MKKNSLITISALLFLSWGTSAQAILIDNDDGTVTDTATNLMWSKDATLGIGLSWGAATTWADTLSLGSFDDWRLPTAFNSDGSGPCLGTNCNDSEFGSLFYDALGNTAGNLTNTGVFNINFNNDPRLDETWFWTNDSPGETCDYFVCVERPYYFQFENGQQSGGGFIWESSPLNAWAVRDVGTTPVPAPATMALLALGLLLTGRYQKNPLLRKPIETTPKINL